MGDRKNLISFADADIMNGESTVIFDLNFKIDEGDFAYIVGKVGSGKTSIIRTIIAENPLVKGSGTVCGYDLATLRNKDVPYLRRRIGVVFQDFQLLLDRSVEANLEFVLKATGWKDGPQICRRINEVLEAVGMAKKAHKMPYQLSGGEQQRVAIARALLNRPELIVADEPTGNLDEETADGIMQLLRQINADGTAVVMVTHNRAIARRYPGRMFECKDEKLTEISKGPGAEETAVAVAASAAVETPVAGTSPAETSAAVETPVAGASPAEATAATETECMVGVEEDGKEGTL